MPGEGGGYYYTKQNSRALSKRVPILWQMINIVTLSANRGGGGNPVSSHKAQGANTVFSTCPVSLIMFTNIFCFQLREGAPLLLSCRKNVAMIITSLHDFITLNFAVISHNYAFPIMLPSPPPNPSLPHSHDDYIIWCNFQEDLTR